jgi:uncharacterized protein DUF5946
MASRSKQWPRFDAPSEVGPLTVADVLAAEAGPPRDKAIMRWCSSVWRAWSADQDRVRALVDRFL